MLLTLKRSVIIWTASTFVAVASGAQPLPTAVSSDALAYLLEVEASTAAEGRSIVGGLRDVQHVEWRLDGRDVSGRELREVSASAVRWVRVDTVGGLRVSLHTRADRTAPRSGAFDVAVVRSDTHAAAGRRAPTLFLLGTVLVSGDDVGRLGARRADVERRLTDVVITRAAVAEKRFGVPVPFTFVRARTDADLRPLLFGRH